MEISPQTLTKYSLFAGLKEDAIKFLMQYMELVQFKEGEKIFSEGDRGSEICFIVSGKVQVAKSGAILAELHEGEQFGEMYVIDIMPRSADVIGSESGSLLKINHRDLCRLSLEDKESFILLLLNCGRDISRRLRRMNDLFVQKAKDV